MRNFSKVMRYAAIPALCLGLGTMTNAATMGEGYVVDSTGSAVTDMSQDRGCVRSTFADGRTPAECGGVAAPISVPKTMGHTEPHAPSVLSKTTVEGKALFDTNKAVLKPQGRSALAKLVREIKSTPGVQEVRVVGYTDSKGSAAHNQILSEHRAQTVKNYLMQNGVRHVTAEGRGEADPVGDNRTAAGRAMNRRVEVEIR